jgi:hypothetical protein
MDVPYVASYARNLRRRPRAEVVETAALTTASTACVGAMLTRSKPPSDAGVSTPRPAASPAWISSDLRALRV